MTVPAFDRFGVIPPIRPGQEGHSKDRAPYAVNLLEFCQAFGSTAQRRRILEGLLRLRAALRATGIQRGFQWLDGSFAEDVERLKGRPPGDIDVVTFAELGSSEEEECLSTKSPHLFDHGTVKRTYGVDHYFVKTDHTVLAAREDLIKLAAYWYSLWAHQRGSFRWKGFASVSLESSDAEAANWLNASDLPKESDS